MYEICISNMYLVASISGNVGRWLTFSCSAGSRELSLANQTKSCKTKFSSKKKVFVQIAHLVNPPCYAVAEEYNMLSS